RRQRRVNTGLLLLLYEFYQVGLHNIPFVTLGVLILNIFLFLNPVRPLDEVCISVNEVSYKGSWQYLLLHPVHHLNNWHLCCNMIFMLWMGILLERKIKSLWFAYIIAVFSVLVRVVYMMLEFLLMGILNDPMREMNCGLGVLFALKVLNDYYNPVEVSSALGFWVSSKFACWVELVAIYLISSRTSFTEHLTGILVGLMYIMGPLKKIMEACAGI
ncbi:Rhomboid-related protein 4, partial [Acanthisitta chloris]